jgi:hypothetical protein
MIGWNMEEEAANLPTGGASASRGDYVVELISPNWRT